MWLIKGASSLDGAIGTNQQEGFGCMDIPTHVTTLPNTIPTQHDTPYTKAVDSITVAMHLHNTWLKYHLRETCGVRRNFVPCESCWVSTMGEIA